MALHRSFWAGLLTAGLFGLLAAPALGQMAGDYDGDGDVDGDDFWAWSGCMTGPAGEAVDPNCAAFDFDSGFMRDGKVDLADFAAFGHVYTAGIRKVPLGGDSVASTTDGEQFKVYVPTKWGGKLTVSTTGGTISELKHPDGSPYTNGAETGENQHGWYKFVVSGSSNYAVSATFVQTGQAESSPGVLRRPWNFYWWAMKGDYIREPTSGNGVANTTAAATDWQMIPVGFPAAPWADIVRCGTDGNLETTAAPDDERRVMYNLFERVNPDPNHPYRPLDKYAQLHGGNPRNWEAAADANTPYEWWGHCFGGAMASILVNQPTPAGGTPYVQEEMEGLWAELGENDSHAAYQYQAGHWMDVGQIPAGPPVPGSDATDAWIGWLHARFEGCIRHERVALQSNLRAQSDPNAANEVWNHAVYKFSATYSEAPGGNERIVHIVNELKANDDHLPPTNDVVDRVFTYTYVVEYQAGEVRTDTAATKDFISVSGQARFAPAWMDHVLSGNWAALNPWVNVADVRTDDGSN